jgi:hypothetical protein
MRLARDRPRSTAGSARTRPRPRALPACRLREEARVARDHLDLVVDAPEFDDLRRVHRATEQARLADPGASFGDRKNGLPKSSGRSSIQARSSRW